MARERDAVVARVKTVESFMVGERTRLRQKVEKGRKTPTKAY